MSTPTQNLKTIINNLPRASGIYLFYNKKGQILYIGKAVNLRSRVRSYFKTVGTGPRVIARGRRDLSLPKNQSWLNEVNLIKIKKTDSEIEALILEAQLIKKHRPKYNVQWRDDKNYFYVGITQEDWSMIFVVHQPSPHFFPPPKKRGEKKRGAATQFIGPFVDGQALKSSLRVLRKIFPYRSCRTMAKHPCLQYHLERCPAPCQPFPTYTRQSFAKQNLGGYTSPSLKQREEKSFNKRSSRVLKRNYRQNIKHLIKILTGKKKSVVRQLKTQMQKASQKKDFEKAARIREQIQGLEKVLAHAHLIEVLPCRNTPRRVPTIPNIWHKRIEAYDISNISGELAAGSMVVFEGGQPKKSDYRRFRIKTVKGANDVAMLKEVLKRRLTHQEWPLPTIILIDGGRPQLNIARETVKPNFMSQKVKPWLLALAKKEELLYTQEKLSPTPLKSLSPQVAFLIQQIRDEAHRFALSYHRRLRKQKLIT